MDFTVSQRTGLRTDRRSSSRSSRKSKNLVESRHTLLPGRGGSPPTPFMLDRGRAGVGLGVPDVSRVSGDSTSPSSVVWNVRGGGVLLEGPGFPSSHLYS